MTLHALLGDRHLDRAYSSETTAPRFREVVLQPGDGASHNVERTEALVKRYARAVLDGWARVDCEGVLKIYFRQTGATRVRWFGDVTVRGRQRLHNALLEEREARLFEGVGVLQRGWPGVTGTDLLCLKVGVEVGGGLASFLDGAQVGPDDIDLHAVYRARLPDAAGVFKDWAEPGEFTVTRHGGRVIVWVATHQANVYGCRLSGLVRLAGDGFAEPLWDYVERGELRSDLELVRDRCESRTAGEPERGEERAVEPLLGEFPVSRWCAGYVLTHLDIETAESLARRYAHAIGSGWAAESVV